MRMTAYHRGFGMSSRIRFRGSVRRLYFAEGETEKFAVILTMNEHCSTLNDEIGRVRAAAGSDLILLVISRHDEHNPYHPSTRSWRYFPTGIFNENGHDTIGDEWPVIIPLSH